MGSPRDRSELQSVIDFFATPLIVDVLRAIRDGRLPRQSPDLSPYGDAVDAAILALANAGTVAGDTRPGQLGSAPSLSLTSKGRMVCALIDEVIDFPTHLNVQLGIHRTDERRAADQSVI